MFVILLFYSNQVRVTEIYVNRLSLLKVLLRQFQRSHQNKPPTTPTPKREEKTERKENVQYTSYFLLLHASNK